MCLDLALCILTENVEWINIRGVILVTMEKMSKNVYFGEKKEPRNQQNHTEKHYQWKSNSQASKSNYMKNTIKRMSTNFSV